MSNDKQNWVEMEEKFGQEVGLPFSEVLTINEIHKAVKKAKGTYRKRVISPAIAIWAHLSQVCDHDTSCRKAATRILAFFEAEEATEKVTKFTPSAYCQAKKRIRTSILANLTRNIGEETSQLATEEHLWCGRRVQVFDGSSLLMQDTKKNRTKYPPGRNQVKEGGFPMARWAVLFSLSTGAVLDSSLAPMEVSERAMFRRFYSSFSQGDVALADRGGCSFYDFALLRNLSVDGVFRMHASKKVDFRKGIQLGKRDHIVVWEKPRFDKQHAALTREEYEQLPNKISVREVAYTVDLPHGRTKTIILATTLLDATLYPKQALADLYFQRWVAAEIDLRHLKTALKLEMVKSKNPKMFHNEVWAHLLVYNLIRRIMWQAATIHRVSV